jgi:hypothetical protein
MTWWAAQEVPLEKASTLAQEVGVQAKGPTSRDSFVHDAAGVCGGGGIPGGGRSPPSNRATEWLIIVAGSFLCFFWMCASLLSLLVLTSAEARCN